MVREKGDGIPRKRRTPERGVEPGGKPETQEKAKRQPRKAKADILAAAMAAEAALSPQQKGMSPSWRRFYAVVRKEVGE